MAIDNKPVGLGMLELMLMRRLAEAEVALMLANKLIDDATAEAEGHQPALSAGQLIMIARCRDIAVQLTEGYEEQLPQGV